MTERELKRLISQGEGVQLECKLSRDRLANSLWETYSSFANTAGGVILLGVRQRGDDFEIAGVADPDRQIRELFDIVNNRTKCNLNLQRMFMFVGYSEQAGSGYQKILSGWRGERWADPFISDDADDCQTFLTLKLNDIPATEHHIVPWLLPGDVTENEDAGKPNVTENVAENVTEKLTDFVMSKGGYPPSNPPSNPPSTSTSGIPHGNETDYNVRKLIVALAAAPLGNRELQKSLSISDRADLRIRYITPALEAGFIVRTQPNAHAPNQKYRLTEKGRALLENRIENQT